MSTEAGIFGSRYTFEGDDSERIRAIADYVDRKMSETAKRIRNVTTSKVAVMTAMTIADELFKLRESVEQAQANNAARLDKLIAVSRGVGSSAKETTDGSPLLDPEESHAQ
jgi:cell division protein ZapA